MTICVSSGKWFSVLGAILLAGCISIPAAIQGTTTPQQDLNVVKNAPRAFIGQEARFGGTVIHITNEKQRTRLEIATVPLDPFARPIPGEPSQGRIIAYVNGFLEPIDFSGHLVTIVGPIIGVKKAKIGMMPYNYIVIDATGYKRWHLLQQIVLPPASIGPWGFRDYPAWGWYGPGQAQIQTIVTE